MKIIGISGKKRSGKTTAGEFIASEFPNKVYAVAFADALKDEVCKACSVSRAYLEANKHLFRLILQGWGSWRRNTKGETYWISKAFEKIYKLPDNCIVVIPDVRHINEAEMLRAIGARLWRVNRIECDVDDQHESEVALDGYDKWDAVITNDETLDKLKIKIQDLIKQQNIK